MAKFSYIARDRRGQRKRGQLSAESKARAKALLTNRGLIPIEITALDASGENGFGRNWISRLIYRNKDGQIQIQVGSQLPTDRELALFTKQFSLMVENGIPILQALKMIEEQQKKREFAEAIGKISSSIEQGATLAAAMEPFKEIFNSLYISMIRAGEVSGRLDLILRQLVLYIEKTTKLKGQVKAASTYPLIIFVVAIAVVTLLLAFVVPSFSRQFADSGQELPGLTAFVIDISNFIVNSWLELVLCFVVGAIGLRYYFKTTGGRAFLDATLLKAPILGDVMTRIAVGRFCSTMSIMMSSGVSILESLNVCASSASNVQIERFIYNVRDSISRGANFADSLMGGGLIPKMVVSMVAVGEATGTLDETLKKISEIYDEEVDQAISSMMSMLEPIMIVTIGGIVGFIVIAMYLPIFSIAGSV